MSKHHNCRKVNKLKGQYDSLKSELEFLKVQCELNSARISTIDGNSLKDEKISISNYVFVANTMDSTYALLNAKDFNIAANVTATSTSVTISIPSLNFGISTTGFMYNKQATNLPQNMWHRRAIPYAFNLPGDQTYVLYIFNDGSIVIGGSNFQPLKGGQHYIYGATVSYPLDGTNTPPTNYKLQSKTTNVTQNGYLGNLLDFYNNDYYDDTFAFVWAGNPSDETTNTLNVNLYGLVGKIDKKGNPVFGQVSLLYAPDNQPGYQVAAEGTISINPTNKNNLVATSNFKNSNVPVGDPSFGRYTGIRSYTLDGGQTWYTNNINLDPGFNLPHFRSDVNALFDSFGNYWMVYMTASTPDYQPPYELVFTVSTDGGITFAVAGQTTLNTFLDYPRLSFGGNGQGGKALWFSVDHVDTKKPNYVLEIIVGYIQVTGLGTYGTLVYGVAQGIGKDTATNSICLAQIPEIVATTDGTVYLLPYIQIKGNSSTQVMGGDNGNYGKTIIYKHTGGISNFNFSPPNDVLMTNIGGNDFNTSGFGKPVPFQPDRGVYPLGARGADYDPINNRLWAVSANINPNNFSPVLDTSPNASYDMSIFVIYSDDGVNWSPEIQISTSSTLPRGMPSIKVNQVNGRKAFFWYDCSDGSNQANVNPFCAFLL